MNINYLVVSAAMAILIGCGGGGSDDGRFLDPSVGSDEQQAPAIEDGNTGSDNEATSGVDYLKNAIVFETDFSDTVITTDRAEALVRDATGIIKQLSVMTGDFAGELPVTAQLEKNPNQPEDIDYIADCSESGSYRQNEFGHSTTELIIDAALRVYIASDNQLKEYENCVDNALNNNVQNGSLYFSVNTGVWTDSGIAEPGQRLVNAKVMSVVSGSNGELIEYLNGSLYEARGVDQVSIGNNDPLTAFVALDDASVFTIRNEVTISQTRLVPCCAQSSNTILRSSAALEIASQMQQANYKLTIKDGIEISVDGDLVAGEFSVKSGNGTVKVTLTTLNGNLSIDYTVDEDNDGNIEDAGALI